MNGTKSNPKNDRVKREYLIWRKEAWRRSPATVEQIRHAIDRLEAYTGYKDFGTFNKDQALGFKHALVEVRTDRTGRPLSISTVHHILQAIRDFLAWLSAQPAYRRRIKPSEIAYLNLTLGEERQAKACGPKHYASLEDYRTALKAMPAILETERRDRALVALILLTGMRDAAVISLKLRHISIAKRYVFQDPRLVDTKFKKPIHSFFLPIGDDIVEIVRDWVGFLANDRGFGPDDALFPKTLVRPDASQNFAAAGLGRHHWADAKPVREIFKTAFGRVGLPYVRPHTVRDTLTQFVYELDSSAKGFKAFSLNLGHDKPLTTFNNYGHLTVEQQGEAINCLGQHPLTARTSEADLVESIAERVVAKLTRI